MKREDLLRSPNYWLAYIQNGLYSTIEDFRIKNKLKKKDLATKLGVSKGYVSQILNGDFDHKLSKLVELSLASGMVPKITYVDLEQYIKDDEENKFEQENKHIRPIQYNITVGSQDYYTVPPHAFKELEKALYVKVPDEVNIESETIAPSTKEFSF